MAALAGYEHIAERFWNVASKGEEEAKREILFMDDSVRKAHIDREIDSRLDGVGTVLDAGAGAGRLSMPRAVRGPAVTHLDLSQPMLAKAREHARQAGVEHATSFAHGRLGDLVQYPDGAFDLVLSVDAPVSYTYPAQADVLAQLVRLARKAVLVSVVSRPGSLPLVLHPAQKEVFLVDPDCAHPIVRGHPRLAPELAETWLSAFAACDRPVADGPGRGAGARLGRLRSRLVAVARNLRLVAPRAARHPRRRRPRGRAPGRPQRPGAHPCATHPAPTALHAGSTRAVARALPRVRSHADGSRHGQGHPDRVRAQAGAISAGGERADAGGGSRRLAWPPGVRPSPMTATGLTRGGTAVPA